MDSDEPIEKRLQAGDFFVAEITLPATVSTELPRCFLCTICTYWQEKAALQVDTADREGLLYDKTRE